MNLQEISIMNIEKVYEIELNNQQFIITTIIIKNNEIEE